MNKQGPETSGPRAFGWPARLAPCLLALIWHACNSERSTRSRACSVHVGQAVSRRGSARELVVSKRPYLWSFEQARCHQTLAKQNFKSKERKSQGSFFFEKREKSQPLFGPLI